MVLAVAAAGFRQLDVIAFDLIDCADMATIAADNFHMLFDDVRFGHFGAFLVSEGLTHGGLVEPCFAKLKGSIEKHWVRRSSVDTEAPHRTLCRGYVTCADRRGFAKADYAVPTSSLAGGLAERRMPLPVKRNGLELTWLSRVSQPKQTWRMVEALRPVP
jgi:hypothetical protein